MTIECHVSHCPFHSCHTAGEEGPFCHEEECRVTEDYIKLPAPTFGILKPSYVDSLTPDERDEIVRTEREHLGDPDKQTGIYHPDNIRGGQSVKTAGPVELNRFATPEQCAKADTAVVQPDDPRFDPERPKFNPNDYQIIDTRPELHHYSVRYEWKIGDDGKTLASTCYFDAMGHQDAMKQFFNLYNGSHPLVSLTIKKSRP